MAKANGIADIAPGETRGRDGVFHLLEAMHQALEARELASRGLLDAQRVGDPDATAYFQEYARQSRALIERARGLLGRRKLPTPARRDFVEESSLESFPASDPPATY